MNQELTVITENSGLNETKAETILSNFTGLFEQAKEWEKKAKAIVVTDVSQVTEMKQAREARLKLKDIRVSAEKTRVMLKEQSLREGKAIDGIANVIKALVVPIEEYLQNQEDFAETQERERKERVTRERSERLRSYVDDYEQLSTNHINLLLRCIVYLHRKGPGVLRITRLHAAEKMPSVQTGQ